MGAGFVMLLWLFVAGVFALIWLVLVIATIIGWRRNIRWLKWSAGITAAMMLNIAVLIAGVLIYGIVESSRPESVFKSTFGTAPPPSVTQVESNVYWFADTGSIYLKFRVSEEEFRKLVPSDLVEQTPEEFEKELPMMLGGEHPKWWTFQQSPEWIYYLRDHSGQEKPGKKGFYSETEYFAYNPVTKTAYYRFLGID